MARRSSARLRSRNSSTPKRVSLSHDADRAPKTVPSKLGSLEESDEMPGSFPRSASPADRTPTGRPAKRVARGVDETPKHSTPRAADEEMHPQKHHQTAAKPMEEARHLGFSNMGAYTAPPKQQQGSRIATLQATPTRTHIPNPAEEAVKSPTYQFTFRREHSLELSPEAKRLMGEKREEAMRIRKQMAASKIAEEGDSEATARKLATPTGKKGRFSDVHSQQFHKMDSIAGHASSFRADSNKKKPGSASKQQAMEKGGEETKSLKRSPSKAQLDDAQSTSKRTLGRSPSKPNLAQASSHLPRTTPSDTLTSRSDAEPSSSPTKRRKHAEAEDVSATRPLSSSDNDDKPLPSTPQQQHKTQRMHPNPNLSAITTPTQASLARAGSVKSVMKTGSKIPAPGLVRSPSKANLTDKKVPNVVEETERLLARSPSKGALFENHHMEKNTAHVDPLLKRSPLKSAAPKHSTEAEEAGSPQRRPKEAPLLARSPLKMSVAKPAGSSDDNEQQSKPDQPALLARSPMKMSTSQSTSAFGSSSAAEVHKTHDKAPAVPLLARSPSKIALPTNPSTTQPQPTTPGKSFGSNLMGRFNLLRSSPMKSILRSPQRLYSDDPAKVAAGTHLATPPKFTTKGTPSASAQKKVDFTSSTKARYQASQSPQVPPTKSTTPQGDPPQHVQTAQEQDDGETPDAKRMDIDSVGYPALPFAPSEASSPMRYASPSPQKRRQTVAPGDFTFRADGHGITFGASPKALASGGSGRMSIRHVSAEPTVAPTTTSKKRKFEFENDGAAADAGTTENKENVGTTKQSATDAATEEPERPAKRTKTSAPSPSLSPTKKFSAPSAASRRTTLGVKPKGERSPVKGGAAGNAGNGGKKDKRVSTISRDRLNALAMPKKRT